MTNNRCVLLVLLPIAFVSWMDMVVLKTWKEPSYDVFDGIVTGISMENQNNCTYSLLLPATHEACTMEVDHQIVLHPGDRVYVLQQNTTCSFPSLHDYLQYERKACLIVMLGFVHLSLVCWICFTVRKTWDVMHRYGSFPVASEEGIPLMNKGYCTTSNL